MTFDSDFDEIFGDLGIFEGKIMKRFQIDLDEILRKIESGEMKGAWKITRINEPGASGYVIQGRIGSDESADPIEPLKPLKRRPLPERLFNIPRAGLKENHEPLVDVFEDENTIRIYMEIPGEEKEDINLRLTEGNVEVKGRNFHRIVELPKRDATTSIVSSEYKNGVLEITIQKKENPFREFADKEKMV
ncbi:MAG: Hsp20/alpha crystallin family protein [Candidatus Bathycorpusculaceae bacterium]